MFMHVGFTKCSQQEEDTATQKLTGYFRNTKSQDGMTDIVLSHVRIVWVDIML